MCSEMCCDIWSDFSSDTCSDMCFVVLPSNLPFVPACVLTYIAACVPWCFVMSVPLASVPKFVLI